MVYLSTDGHPFKY